MNRAYLPKALTDIVTNIVSQMQGNVQFCSVVLKINKDTLIKTGELQTYRTHVAIRDLWLEDMHGKGEDR